MSTSMRKKHGNLVIEAATNIASKAKNKSCNDKMGK